MADVVKKKKSRRLKRSVRRTLGTLFLVSALVVAAVPTDGLGREAQAYAEGATAAAASSYHSGLTWEQKFKAATPTDLVNSSDGTKVGIQKSSTAIPLLSSTFQDIYCDETGNIQFAWLGAIRGKSGAMLLQYDGYGDLSGGNLVIPNTVDAYALYSAQSGRGRYAAVSQSREPLYYMAQEWEVTTKQVPTGEYYKDAEGNLTNQPIYRTELDTYKNPSFSLCDRDDNAWKYTGSLTDNGTKPASYIENNFFYRIKAEDFSSFKDKGKLVNEDSFKGTNGEFINLAIEEQDVFKYGDDYYVRARETNHQWVCDQPVYYIGNQYLTSTNTASGGSTGTSDDSSGTYTLVQEYKIDPTVDEKANEDPNKGIFAGESNITTLTLGADLMGVGNYAFYHCTGMERATFGNGLTEIGHDAFAHCASMNGVSIPYNCKLTFISDSAFAYSGIQTFALPLNVQTLYDSVFEGCDKLVSVDLIGEKSDPIRNPDHDKDPSIPEYYKAEPRLDGLGCSVFKGCNALTSVTFPSGLKSDIHLDNFEGCTALQFIKVLSNDTGFVPHDEAKSEYTVNDFLDHLGSAASTIYFEGNGKANGENSGGESKAHKFTRESARVPVSEGSERESNAIAFKYADDQQQYEIITIEKGEGGKDAYLTYQVNDSNQLIYFNMSDTVAEVSIPAQIGPKGITAITAENGKGFTDNCFLKKIIIPASVTTIGSNAFKGCHNLRHVIFTDASTITEIGADAFRTQVMNVTHQNGCSGSFTTPSLTFTGLIATNGGKGNVTKPFAYAMGMLEGISNRINSEATADCYIKYYSGWPSMLEVQYNPETGKSMLTDYPSIADLKATKYTLDNYPFMTEDYVKAVTLTLKNYGSSSTPGEGGETGGGTSDPGETEEEAKVAGYAAALKGAIENIVLPRGIESIEPELFVNTEKEDNINHSNIGKKLTVYGLTEVEDKAFAGFKSLTSANFADSTLTSLGAYAFDECENLSQVSMPVSLQKMGLRPFRGCTKLKSVNFMEGSAFREKEGVIFGPYIVTDETDQDQDGDTTDDRVVYSSAVMECLEASTGSFNPLIFAGIQGMAPEAFMDCSRLDRDVDLSKSSIRTIPVDAFNGAGKFRKEDQGGNLDIYLPEGCASIDKNAFHNSGVRDVYMPDTMRVIDEQAFNTPVYRNDQGSFVDPLRFLCSPEAIADDLFTPILFANGANRSNIAIKEKDSTRTYSVTFRVEDSEGNSETYWMVQDDIVPGGRASLPPNDPVREGYTFRFWQLRADIDYTRLENVTLDKNGVNYDAATKMLTDIERNLVFYAVFRNQDSTDEDVTIHFINDDNVTEITTRTVPYGESLDPGWYPANPKSTKGDYLFTGWSPSPVEVKPVDNRTGAKLYDFNTYAQYDYNKKSDGTSVSNSGNSGGNGNGDGSGSGNNGGDGSGNNGGDGSGSGSGSNNNGGNGTTSSNGSSTLYTLTVVNGSGSGSYVAGAQPFIVANSPATGQVFSHWTVDPENTVMATKTVEASLVTMPAANVTVTAHYKAAAGSSSGSGSSASGNTSRPNGSVGTVTNGGTTVVIDKNGLSNTGVVSAVVNGSSDNFTIKISESSAATEAVLRALTAEYGNDLSNIKYFPMDISLYDSTGTKKITDTTGLRISITLPLPDSLIPYAGNNKVAGVVNDRLDKLTPRFTTIDGVSCVTFVAEHFSPYVIYVDTSRLSDGTVADSTPKTGDGIHPKWFLSIGLACLSFVMFMQKDNKKKEKVKVRARA